MNAFDSLKRTAFDVVTNLMGYNAKWTSSESGSSELTARVGYKDPSEAQELSGIGTWDPDEPFMEYRIDFFPGLKARVDAGHPEHVTIEGVGYFAIKQIKTKVDGDVYEARLQHDTP